jgi:hypothetical protein
LFKLFDEFSPTTKPLPDARAHYFVPSAKKDSPLARATTQTLKIFKFLPEARYNQLTASNERGAQGRRKKLFFFYPFPIFADSLTMQNMTG